MNAPWWMVCNLKETDIQPVQVSFKLYRVLFMLFVIEKKRMKLEGFIFNIMNSNP